MEVQTSHLQTAQQASVGIRAGGCSEELPPWNCFGEAEHTFPTALLGLFNPKGVEGWPQAPRPSLEASMMPEAQEQ